MAFSRWCPCLLNVHSASRRGPHDLSPYRPTRSFISPSMAAIATATSTAARAAVSPSRMQALLKLRAFQTEAMRITYQTAAQLKFLNGRISAGSTIFQTSYNPSNARTGAKYLRAPLRGPAMLQYYPPLMPKISTLNKEIPELGAIDFLEEQRCVVNL